LQRRESTDDRQLAGATDGDLRGVIAQAQATRPRRVGQKRRRARAVEHDRVAHPGG
jgi:hypothetical protein